MFEKSRFPIISIQPGLISPSSLRLIFCGLNKYNEAGFSYALVYYSPLKKLFLNLIEFILLTNFKNRGLYVRVHK